MFLDFLFFEIKLRSRSISTYLFFGLWLVLTFLFVAAPDFFVGPGKVMANSPFVTQQFDFIFCFYGCIIMAATFGTSILRDFQRDTYQLIFTKPITKFSYLGGRWAGSLVISLFIFAGIPLGEALGALAPWADHTRLAPFNPAMLGYHYAVIIVPQVFFLGSLFFLVAALTRRIMVVYLQGVALFIVYITGAISVQQTNSLNRFWPAVCDPVGMLLFNSITRYWTVAEQNTLWMPFTGMFLWNRVVWFSAGLVTLAAVYHFFPMSAELLTVRRSRKQKAVGQESTAPPTPRFHHLLPTVFTSHSWLNRTQQFLSLTRIYSRNIFREIPFWAITLLLVGFSMINGHFAGTRDGYNVWPVTYLMLEVVRGNAILFLYIISTMYAGELVWRERDTHFDQIHDALPFRGWIDTLSKLSALVGAQLFLLTVTLLCGVLSQAIAGYYNIELLQYVKELYVITFPDVLIFALLAFFVQTIVPNKFIGHGIVVGVFALQLVLEGLGRADHLFVYGDMISYTYSDMNGYGHFVRPLFWSTFYWLAWAILLGVLASLLARRGTDTGLRARLQLARQSLPAYALLLAIPVMVAIGSGGWIYYNTHVLNTYHTDKYWRKQKAEYEKLYKKYELAPIPKIVAVDTAVNIYPQQRSFSATGTYTAINQSGKPIQDIYLTNNLRSIRSISFDRPATATLADTEHGFWIYHLDPDPLPVRL
jgi:hypothetical protein